MTGASRWRRATRLLPPRAGFGLAEVIVALVVFAIGALGAAALTAHAARIATLAQAREAAVLQATMLLDSLARGTPAGSGLRRDPAAELRWSVEVDSAARRIRIEALPTGASDTIRLVSQRPPLPPVIDTW